MAVRFLPERPEQHTSEARADRGELAEVLDLRSRLPSIVAQASEVSTGKAEASEEPFEAEAASIEPSRTAAEDGVRILARKALSSGELQRELVASGHTSSEAEEVIAEFVQRLYLDDLGLARVLTEKLRERKRASRSQIRMKLRERQISNDAIETALGELDEEEEYKLLRETAEDRAKRLGGLDRVTAERRLLGFLARRGWSGERATRAAREALDHAGGGSSVRFR